MKTSKQKIFKQIVIDHDNYEKLKNLGHTGQSFNDVIRTLLTKEKVTTQEVLLS